MRKKIGFLVLGLIMAATAYAADEVQTQAVNTEVKQETVVKKEEGKKEEKKIPKTKWDFSDSNVEFKAYLYDSQSGAVKMGKDEDFILKVKRQLDEKTWISVKYDSDDSNPDYTVELLAGRKFNDYLEAQMDMDLKLGDKLEKDSSGQLVSKSQGVRLEEDNDSEKVFIKYTPNKNLAIKFNPFDIDLEVGDEYNTKDTKGSMVVPGAQIEYKLSDTMMIYGGLGANKVKDTSDDKDKTAIGIKAGFENKGENSSLIGMFAMNTQDDKNIASPSPIKMAANLRGSYKTGNLSLKAEALATQLNKAAGKTDEKGEVIDSTDFALYAKAGYKMGNITPYVAGRYVGGSVYFDDDDYCAIISGADAPLHGGLTVIEAGSEFEIKGGVKIVPYIELQNAKEKVFEDADGKDKKSVVTFNTKVKVSF